MNPTKALCVYVSVFVCTQEFNTSGQVFLPSPPPAVHFVAL